MVLLSYVFTLSLVSILAYLLWRQESDGVLKKVFFPALTLKLLLGIILGFFYKQYGGDANGFHKQALILYQYFQDSPLGYLKFWFTGNYESETVRGLIRYKWWSNSYLMIKLLSLTNIITNGHFYLNSLFFSLFSFFGLWKFTKALIEFNLGNKYAVIFCFLFLPSVTFWSSGISKEAIYLGSLGWFLSLILRMKHDPAIRYPRLVGELLLAAYILWKIKYFFALGVFVLVFLYMLINFKKAKKYCLLHKNYLIPTILLFITIVILIIPLAHVFNLDYFLYELNRNYTTLSAASIGKPALIYPDLEPSLSSVLRHATLAFFNASFRPFLWESNEILYLIAGLENLIWLLITSGSLVSLFFFKPKRIDAGLILLAIYCFLIGALIGLSTPNLGTLSRYKTAFLPFLIYICLQAPFFTRLWQKVNSAKGKL